MAKVIEGLYYSESHEFVRVEGDYGFVGITDYAQTLSRPSAEQSLKSTKPLRISQNLSIRMLSRTGLSKWPSATSLTLITSWMPRLTRLSARSK